MPITIIILTYNEEKNIEACLNSVCSFAKEIFIVDSYSTDKTLEIAKRYTNNIYQHSFETQARQFNWALDNLQINTEWVMRLDADERVTQELANELCEKLLSFSSDITGLYFKRKVYFMDRFIKHGGYYPTWLLRIWRKGKARSEEQILNEHIILLEGKSAYLRYDIIDWNQKGLSFWTEKHNNYSARFASELIAIKDSSIKELSSINVSLFGSQEERKRWLKQNLYVSLPLFIRTFIYFIYRYFFRLGFLDGKEGLIFHFLQGFWYPFLVDAKICEYEKQLRK
ncbi:MAG: glycosyltransferase family 2 protein [Candidatus Melainabacteria bacterium]|nr:glycosyltransferase family 2 protein [Candidatus Melainabacteria bacterium]